MADPAPASAPGDRAHATSAITDAMLAHYWEHGFVVARGLVPERDLAAYRERLADIVEGRVAPPR
ncbi:MAG: hypothetical protein R3E88_19890, partial [Myxococcota bacterium]